MTRQDFVLESIFSKVLEYFILGAFVGKAKIFFFSCLNIVVSVAVLENNNL